VGEGEKAVRNEAVTDRKGCELVASAAIMGIVSERNVRFAGAEAASSVALAFATPLAPMMTTSSRRSSVPARSLSETNATVMAAAHFRMKRCAATGGKESSMVFFLTLLGSMIVCEAFFCGDLRRMLATTTEEVRHRQEHVALILIAACAYGTAGRDYRWE
jgi:hypothetical protein